VVSVVVSCEVRIASPTRLTRASSAVGSMSSETVVWLSFAWAPPRHVLESKLGNEGQVGSPEFFAVDSVVVGYLGAGVQI